MPYDPRCPENFFKCQQCGDCCIGFGGTRLTDQDIQNIANYLEIPPAQLIAEYCQIAGNNLHLAQKQGGYCIFWNQLCTIHPVKPRMCKAWPFIESVLLDPDNWQIMAAMCPGIDPDAPVEALKKCVRRQLRKLDETADVSAKNK